MSDEEFKEIMKKLVIETEMAKKSAQIQYEKTQKQMAETDRQLKETDKQLKEYFRETDKQLKETDKQLKETDRHLKETDEQVKRTSKKVEELTKDIFGISKSNGLVAEDFFYDNLKEHKKLGNIKFDYVEKNIKARIKDLEGQYDIVLYNGDSIGLVEVKYKAKLDHIDKLKNKQIESFKQLFPQYKDYKFYGVIAGLAIAKEVENRALKNGLFVLKQSGNDMKTIIPKL